jgi:hypothetical protein
MDREQEHERNNVTYRRLKEVIRQTYPRDWFVGIADDQVVGGAADFHGLEQVLRASGKDPRRVLVVQAGADYPDHVTILISPLRK